MTLDVRHFWSCSSQLKIKSMEEVIFIESSYYDHSIVGLSCANLSSDETTFPITSGYPDASNKGIV